ncbi:hypothetical protein D3C86_1704820 [compost metagenome]
MQVQGLQLLQQNAAVALDNGFGQASGAGRKQHPERMLERQLFEVKLSRRHGRTLAQRVPADGFRDADGRLGKQHRQNDDLLDTLQRLRNLPHLRATIMGLPAVAVAIDGDENPGT